MKDNHVSGARKLTYNQNRYNKDYVETIHYNNNGRKACSIFVLNPQHSAEPSEVTCRNCLKKIRIQNAKQ